MRNQAIINEKILYGTRMERFLREFLTSSGVFFLFDMLRKIVAEDGTSYFVSLPHWILFGASLIQTWVITRNTRQINGLHYFIAPALYTIIDMVIEGSSSFWAEPYHLFYWIWAAYMALMYVIYPRLGQISTIGTSIGLVLLLVSSYMFSEWEIASVSFYDYWMLDRAHLFILLGTLLLGVILGLTYIMRNRFEQLLYRLAEHFERIASWSFDSNLIGEAYEEESALALKRHERTLLFMDIRGFTPWSEAHTPDEVVSMLNTFYRAAEPIIIRHHGFKIQMQGDEIMTRFSSVDDGLSAALELQKTIQATLQAFNLSAGIGVHTGSVIEGLVGGEMTRQYGIFGDIVNTSARLQSQAHANEVVVSDITWQRVAKKPTNSRDKELTLKGKTEPFKVHIVSPG
jgi:class 3 adenylate cyclase